MTNVMQKMVYLAKQCFFFPSAVPIFFWTPSLSSKSSAPLIRHSF